MFFLIKLVLILAILSGVFVYGETAWESIKEKVAGITNPELQRANILDSFKSNFSEIEEIIKQVNQNIDNPDFDKKTHIEEALNLIEESKSGLQELGQSEKEPSFIENTFENLNDLKDGVRSLFTENKGADSQSSETCQCSEEN